MADEEVDDFLAHFGIKGMKWGQRKSESSAPDTRTDLQKYKDVEKEFPLHNNRGSWEGGLLRQHYAKKVLDKERRKDESFDFNKIDGERRRDLQQKIQRKAMTDLALRTTGEAAAAVVIGKVGGAKLFGLNSSNSTKAGLAFAGMVIAARGKQMVNVRDAYKEVKFQDARRDIYRSMSREDKIKAQQIERKGYTR